MNMSKVSTFTAATQVVAKRLAKRGVRSLVCAVGTLLAVSSAHAASGTWDTDSLGNWTDITKWLGDAAYATDADSTAIFGNYITAARTINLNAPITIGNITASDTTHDYTISGANILTLDRTTDVPTIDVTTSGRTLTISSQIAGTDGLKKNGAGTLTLSGANTYSGGTTVSAGVILVSNNSGFGSGAITVTGNSSIGAAHSAYSQVANPLQVDATKTLTIPGGSQYYGITFTGVVSGSGTISVVGGNDANTRETFGMTNAGNTFTGNLSLSGGSAIINVNSLGDGGKITLGANNVTGGFQLGAGTATSLLFNTRQIELAGSSALYNNNATPSTTFTVNTTLAFSGTGVRTLTLGGSNTGANTFGGIIGNNGANAVSLIKESAGKWILTGANTYSGTTTISGGILEIGGSGSLGSSGTYAATISNAGTLRFNSSANQTLSGVISGAGALIQDGMGTLSLTRSNTYSGNTTVNAGTLSLGNGTSNSSLADASTLTVASGATLNLNYSGSDTVLYLNLSGAPAAAGEWGATDSDAANKSPLITGTGRINNLGGDSSMFNIGYWDGGSSDILANGNLASGGTSGTWNTSLMNWDYGTVAHKVWANTSLSSAVFAGTAGTVTLGEPISLKNLTINTDYYTITGGTLNFAAGGKITVNSANNGNGTIVETIRSAITGAPTVALNTGGGNTETIFEPTSGSIQLGAVSGNGQIGLGGTTSGNTVTNGIVNGDNKVRKYGTATWTVYGDVSAYEHFIQSGTLIVNGNMTGESRGINLSGGILEVNGTLRNSHSSYGFIWSGTSRLQGNCTFQNAGSQTLTVPATGTLAPGKPTGTFTNANAVTINGKLAVTINGAQCSKLAVGNTLTISSATLDVNVMSNPSSAVTIATYTTLSPSSGPFATVTGLPSGWTIDYQANGGKAITLTPPPAGTLIQFF